MMRLWSAARWASGSSLGSITPPGLQRSRREHDACLGPLVLERALDEIGEVGLRPDAKAAHVVGYVEEGDARSGCIHGDELEHGIGEAFVHRDANLVGLAGGASEPEAPTGVVAVVAHRDRGARAATQGEGNEVFGLEVGVDGRAEVSVGRWVDADGVGRSIADDDELRGVAFSGEGVLDVEAANGFEGPGVVPVPDVSAIVRG